MAPNRLLMICLVLSVMGCTFYRSDGPEQKKSDRVYLCHRGETLRLDDNAIRAHLNHGDQLGICSADNDGSSGS